MLRRHRLLSHVVRGGAALATALALVSCSSGSDEATDPQAVSSPTQSDFPTADVSECSYPADASGSAVEPPSGSPSAIAAVPVVLDTTWGQLSVQLDGVQAPCTVNSFLSLAEQGYFDGTDCHRLTTEGIFVLQCGDPTGTGTGGPGYSFADELSGQETYPAGTLAMANAGPDTNGSQFFIVYADTPLPPNYTVFGQVDPAGITAVAEAASAGTSTGAGDGPPKTPATIKGVVLP